MNRPGLAVPRSRRTATTAAFLGHPKYGQTLESARGRLRMPSQVGRAFAELWARDDSSQEALDEQPHRAARRTFQDWLVASCAWRASPPSPRRMGSCRRYLERRNARFADPAQGPRTRMARAYQRAWRSTSVLSQVRAPHRRRQHRDRRGSRGAAPPRIRGTCAPTRRGAPPPRWLGRRLPGGRQLARSRPGAAMRSGTTPTPARRSAARARTRNVDRTHPWRRWRGAAQDQTAPTQDGARLSGQSLGSVSGQSLGSSDIRFGRFVPAVRSAASAATTNSPFPSMKRGSVA